MTPAASLPEGTNRTAESPSRSPASEPDQAPRLTVLYPLHDTRGGGTDHVRTWLQGQSLPRQAYRVIVATTGETPELEREIEAMMTEQDCFVHAPANDEVPLWSAAAEAAETPWLLFTEGHCVADPKCLEAVDQWASRASPRIAGNCAIGNTGQGRAADLYPVWFRSIQDEWRKPDQWRRLHRSGFVIHKESLAEVHGIAADCGQFAPTLLSARLHEAGIEIADIDGAGIVHVDSRNMVEHHFDTASHANGELLARSRTDSRFCDGYFGYIPAWTNRWQFHPEISRALTRGAITMARTRPGLRNWAVALESIGRRMRPKVMLPWQQALTWFDEIVVDHLPMPQSLRLGRFLQSHQRIVETTRIKWLKNHVATLTPAHRECGHWTAEDLDPDGMVGVYPLEEYQGRWFQWTEPVTLIRRLPPVDGAHLLSIETAGFQGDLAGSVQAIVAGGRALPLSHLEVEDSRILRVLLPAGWATHTNAGIVLVATGSGPTSNSRWNRRRLGLPVASVRIEPAPTKHR